jgi:hypothetical protein
MHPTLRILTLICAAASPLSAFAQDMSAPATRPTRALGEIAQGTEQMFQVSAMLDLSRQPSQEEVNAALDPATFSIPAASGFCIAAAVAADPTIVVFNGASGATGEGLFNADSGNDGLTSPEGRRSFVRTVGPVPESSFLLSTIVAQNARATGNTATIFVRVYPDTATDAELDAICGPFREGSMQAPMPGPGAPPVPPAAN